MGKYNLSELVGTDDKGKDYHDFSNFGDIVTQEELEMRQRFYFSKTKKVWVETATGKHYRSLPQEEINKRVEEALETITKQLDTFW